MPFIPEEQLEQEERLGQLQQGIAQEKAQVEKIQAQNRFNKLKTETAHIPTKDLEKMNMGGKLTPLILDRKSDEKASEQLVDAMAEQKINQATGTTKLQRDADKETESNLSKSIGSFKSDTIEGSVKRRRSIFIPDVKEERSDLLTAPIETLKRSGKEFVGGIAEAVTHPIQTATSLVSLAKGTVQKLIPGEQEDEKTVNAVADFYKERYGGLEEAKRTILEDPIGFAADLSLFMGGSGAVAAKIGKVAKVGKVAKTGAKVAKAAQFVDPLALTMKGAGKTFAKISKATPKIRPFAGKVDAKTMDAAKKLGVEIPASAKTTGKVAPLAESLVSKGLFGNKLDNMVESARSLLIDKADDIVKRTTKSPDLSGAGLDIIKGSEKYRENFMNVKAALYKKALDVEKGGSRVFVPPKESLKFVDKIVSKKIEASKILGPTKDIAFFKRIKSKLGKSKSIDGKIYRSAIRELNEKIKNFNDPITTGNRGALKKTVTLLSNELDDAIITQRPDLSQALEKANSFYAEGISKLNSSYGKKIFSLKDKPDKILPAIINKNTSIDDIPRIYEVIGKENIPSVQAAFLEDMFKKSKNVQGEFTPGGLGRQIKSFGEEKLSKVLSKEQFDAVKNIEEVTKALGRFDKISKGSQTAFLTRIVTEASILFTNPLLGLKIIGGDFLLSKAITSKAGQALLAEGFKPTGKIGEAIAKTTKPLRVSQISRIKKATEN